MKEGPPHWLRFLGSLPEPALARFVASLPPDVQVSLDEDWALWANAGQREPEGDWLTWLMQAGRGFGKTRAGAEWVWARARELPGARIALIGGTLDDVARVMVEGPSGLIATARHDEADGLRWLSARKIFRFPSGAEAYAYSGEKPARLRGPEHHFAWCDELAKWTRPNETWDMLQFGLRAGARPRTVITTTPRCVPALKRIIALERTRISYGRTQDNPHSSREFVATQLRTYGGSRLGRQELDGELIEGIEAALWPPELIEKSRGDAPADLVRVVIGVDPPAGTEGDACGIVACGLAADGIAYVLGDHSVSGLSPDGWARKVAAAAEAWDAHRVVAEANNGGKMVETVLRGASLTLPVRLVHAADGKAARAEPVAALFECGQAKLAGPFPVLEDELMGLGECGRYEGPGRSPDRADAMVWALTELKLGRRAAEPRIRQL
jgi:phage terminase large subunit-like protein